MPESSTQSQKAARPAHHVSRLHFASVALSFCTGRKLGFSHSRFSLGSSQRLYPNGPPPETGLHWSSSAQHLRCCLVCLEGALIEIISPKVGGVEASDGTWVEGKQMLGGGPSVLYDAVAVLASPDGAALLAKDAAAKDFVSDAFAHCKFIGYSADAMPLFEKARDRSSTSTRAALNSARKRMRSRFVEMCRDLRFWEREPKVKS